MADDLCAGVIDGVICRRDHDRLGRHTNPMDAPDPRITTNRHHGRFIRYRPYCGCRFCRRTRVAIDWMWRSRRGRF